MQALYNPALIVLSIVVAIVASFTALKLAARVAHSRGAVGHIWLAGGAASMGLGIWSMHFIGMLAMSLPIPLRYDLVPTIGSALIAVITSGFAIAIAGRNELSSARLACSGLIMGLGVTAMHYTGMAAIRITPAISYNPSRVAVSVAIAISASCAALWLAFQLRGGNSARMRWARLAAACVMGLAIAGMHYTAMSASRFAMGSFCLGGVALNNTWIAVTIGLLSLGLLVITLMTAVFDAHLESRSREHSRRLEQINADLHYQATHDALTRLPNRMLFNQRLETAIAEAALGREHFAVLAIDLDRFKLINDSLGHAAGDDLLLQVAERLSGLIRSGDVAARVGGDEFLLLLRRVRDRAELARRAQEILELLNQAYWLRDLELHATPSIGISVFPEDALQPSALMSQADEAMYSAKQAGRNAYRFFTAGTTVFTPERLRFENDLRRAAGAGQLLLHYQPQVQISDGQIVALEALLRWQHPDLGMVRPDRFIPVAEETGLMLPIGEWVLRAAVQQLQRWHRAGHTQLRIAVNLSATQFRQDDLVAMVGSVLQEHHVPPRCLELELTESAVMADADRSVAVLTQLRQMGVSIAIDDFGTGYSCISHLKRLPIDKLKIDRSFVAELGGNAEDDAIVQAIVSLGHTLRLGVIAEGVESSEQLDALRERGCDEYQGFFCSKPVAAADIDLLLRRRPRMSVLDTCSTFTTRALRALVG